MPTTARAVCVETPPRSVTPSPLTLDDRLSEFARRLHRSVPQLTSSEAQVLKDMQRDRYSFTGIDWLCKLSARSALPHHRFGLPEVIRAEVIRHGGAPTYVERHQAWDDEDDSNARLDKAMRKLLSCPCETHRAEAIEAAEEQYARTRILLDSLSDMDLRRLS